MAFPGRGVQEEEFGLLQCSQQNKGSIFALLEGRTGVALSHLLLLVHSRALALSLSARVLCAPVSEHHVLLCSQVRSGVPFQILQLRAGEEIPARHI